MAVKHKSDSIQLIRDTEGIDNKDRVRILSPGSSPPKETTEVTEHALYMELENTPGDGEAYEYEFACASGRRFIPQRAGDANKLEGKTSAEVKALFADGRAVFAGSGTSVTLDANGDRVHSITVNGFTKQLGTGDASPVNVREILVGGMQANLLDKTKAKKGVWTKSSSGDISYNSGNSSWYTCRVPVTAGDKVVISGRSHINGAAADAFIGNDEDTPISWSLVNTTSKLVAPKGAKYLDVAVEAKYNEVPVDDLNKVVVNLGTVAAPYSEFSGSKYGVVIKTSGSSDTNKLLKLTAPLCEGDKVISKVKSGCDKKLVLDGTKSFLVDPASTFADVIRFSIQLSDANKASPVVFSERFTPSTVFTLNSEYIGITDIGKLIGAVYKNRLSSQDAEGIKAYFAANPLPVWYCSTAYTDSNDIPVALEVHASNRIEYTGDEVFYSASVVGEMGYYFFQNLDNANTGGANQSDAVCSHLTNRKEIFDSALDKTKANVFCVGASSTPRFIMSHEVLGTSPSSDVRACKEAVAAYLKNQYAQGTPMVLVYKMKTPITYAHDPVDLIASPGEDGAWVITGEADGTLDVYYKALQDGGDADKLGGKLPEYYAAAANALGQYTHTKSGTVHELTGTGDNIRFVATADFAAGDTVKVNGTTCTASTMSGDALWAGFFKSGAVVVCYRTGNALNFSGGGLAAAEAAKITPENLKTGVSVTVNGKTVAGTFTADGTAAAGDMLLGKTGYVKGQKITGTIPSKAAASYKPGTSAQTIKAVQYLSGDQTIEGDAALIAANIKYGASIFDVDGSFTSDANAVAAEILTGKIGYVKGQKITGSMPNRGAVSQWLGINGTYTIPAGYHNGQGVVKQSIPTKGEATYTPSTREQVIEKNQYLTGSQFIKGDGNLVAGNIRSGVSIFGVAGSFMEGSGGYLYMGQRNNTAMYGYAFGSASYSNGIRIGRSGNYLLVMFGYNETGATGRMKVNGSDVFAYGLNPAAVHTTTKWLNAGDIVTISADEGVNYALTGFVYNT